MKSSKDKLQQAIDKLNSTIPEERQQLNQWLREDKALREDLASYLLDEEILIDELKLEQIEQMVTNDKMLPIAEPSHINRRFSSSKILTGLTYAAMGAVAATLVMGIFEPARPDGSSADHLATTPIPEVDKTWIAKVKDYSTDTEWGSTQYIIEDELPRGKHTILQGQVALTFSNDVELVIQSPASFELISNMEMLLHNGKLRAHVSEQGYGFVIDTPKTKVRDLGTEFGVAVDKAGQTEVHVFSGEVELYESAQSEPELAKEGFAARWSDAGRGQLDMPNEASFPNSHDIRRDHWEQYRAKMKQQNDTVAYFDFTGHTAAPNVLSNQKGEIPNGLIHNPSWVTGRWPNKKALLFDANHSRVDLNLDTKGRSFTLQMWIKPDRFASSLSAVLNSNDWEKGGHHLQITNRGELRVGVGGKQGYAITSAPSGVELGKWSLLTMTYDHQTREVNYYINQTKVLSKLSKTPFIDLSLSSLGCWRVAGKSRRKFSGRIDELSLQYRFLTPQQVDHSYLAGYPY